MFNNGRLFKSNVPKTEEKNSQLSEDQRESLLKDRDELLTSFDRLNTTVGILSRAIDPNNTSGENKQLEGRIAQLDEQRVALYERFKEICLALDDHESLETFKKNNGAFIPMVESEVTSSP